MSEHLGRNEPWPEDLVDKVHKALWDAWCCTEVPLHAAEELLESIADYIVESPSRGRSEDS